MTPRDEVDNLAWLTAREAGAPLPMISAPRALAYDGLCRDIEQLPDDSCPRPGWEARVLAALDAQVSTRRRHLSRRRAVVIGAVVLAAVAAGIAIWLVARGSEGDDVRQVVDHSPSLAPRPPDPKPVPPKPTALHPNLQLAEVLWRGGKHKRALAILSKAFAVETTHVDAGILLARCYEETGRKDDAAALYDQLLAGPEITIDLRARAGQFYARLGKTEKARLQGDEILKLDDKNPAGLFLEGYGLLADGKIDDARRALQEASDLDKDPQYLDAFGQVNEALAARDPSNADRYRDDALKAYIAANQGDAKLVRPLAGMGRIYNRKRQYQKAVDVLVPANKLAPNDADIQFQLGLAYYTIDSRASIAWTNKSLATRPQAIGYLNVGMLHYDAGDMKEAAPALTRAVELGLADERAAGKKEAWMEDAYYKLGDAENELGHEAAAKKAWQAYIDREPKDQVKIDKVKREMLGMRR